MTPSVQDPSVDAVPAGSVSGLSHVFDERRALRSIDLQVPSGCLHGLVGPNGAGKSTTIRMLTATSVPLEMTASDGSNLI